MARQSSFCDWQNYFAAQQLTSPVATGSRKRLAPEPLHTRLAAFSLPDTDA